MHPRVSVVVPAYESADTLQACLQALARQTFTDFELVIVDSTPLDDEDGHRARTSALLDRVAFAVRPVENVERLTPHVARNLGVCHARGSLLVFTDPDIYPEPGWLASLVRAYDTSGGVVFGPLACHGRRWFDIGVHLCKFAICLPEPGARPLVYGWSGNMLCARALFDAVGGFPDSPWHGDTLLSVRLGRAGVALRFEPAAVVRHDHEAIRLGPYLRERFVRGGELARLAADGSLLGRPWTRVERFRRVMTSCVWPLKVAAACLDVARGARRAGQLREFAFTLPVIVAGQTAWVLGASLRYVADGCRLRP